MSVKPDQEWTRVSTEQGLEMNIDFPSGKTELQAPRPPKHATYWKDTATTLGRMLRAERVGYAKLERKLAFYMIVGALGWGTLVMALVNGWGA